MSNFKLENYLDVLDHQVIHMDQGLCYNPEYRANRRLSSYPSRKLQLVRSVYTGEIEATEKVEDVVFETILSRLGERWQNFREDPEDYTDAMLLGRALLVEKGLGTKALDKLRASLTKNNGTVHPVTQETLEQWQNALPLLPDATTFLALDDATAVLAKDSAAAFGAYCQGVGLTFSMDLSVIYPGFELFAHGALDEGAKQLKSVVDTYNAAGAKVVYSLSGQVTYLLTTFCDKLGIQRNFTVVDLVDTLTEINVDKPSFVYGGSFYTRYLNKSDKLNALFANSREEKIQQAPEFYPIVKADRRVNNVNMWQKPVGAEYTCLTVPAEMAESIADDAVNEIRRGNPEQLVVFEPYALGILKEKCPDIPVRYYLELLN